MLKKVKETLISAGLIPTLGLLGYFFITLWERGFCRYYGIDFNFIKVNLNNTLDVVGIVSILVIFLGLFSVYGILEDAVKTKKPYSTTDFFFFGYFSITFIAAIIVLFFKKDPTFVYSSMTNIFLFLGFVGYYVLVTNIEKKLTIQEDKNRLKSFKNIFNSILIVFSIGMLFFDMGEHFSKGINTFKVMKGTNRAILKVYEDNIITTEVFQKNDTYYIKKGNIEVIGTGLE